MGFVGCRWRRKEWKQMSDSLVALSAKRICGCFCFCWLFPCVFFPNFFASHSTVIQSFPNTQLWSPETGRRLWTLTLQCTTQTGSTHSCTSTTTVQRENVRHKHTLSLALLLADSFRLFFFFFFRPAHRARTPAVPPTAHSGIRTIQQLTEFCASASCSPQHAEKSARV